MFNHLVMTNAGFSKSALRDLSIGMSGSFVTFATSKQDIPSQLERIDGVAFISDGSVKFMDLISEFHYDLSPSTTIILVEYRGKNGRNENVVRVDGQLLTCKYGFIDLGKRIKNFLENK